MILISIFFFRIPTLSLPFVFLCQMFHYQETAYPPDQGLFKGHAVWSGDIMRKDASITLHEVQPTFNGTYTCQVANPPDAHGNSGEIVLRVVNKGETLLFLMTL